MVPLLEIFALRSGRVRARQTTPPASGSTETPAPDGNATPAPEARGATSRRPAKRRRQNRPRQDEVESEDRGGSDSGHAGSDDPFRSEDEASESAAAAPVVEFSDESDILSNDDRDSNDGRGPGESLRDRILGLVDDATPLDLKLGHRALSRVSQFVSKHTGWLQTHRPAVCDVDLAKFIPQVEYDTWWTELDEEALQDALAADAFYQYLGSLDKPSHVIWAPTWAKIMRIMGCLPTDIIGPKRYLASNSYPEVDVGGQRYANPHWTPKFCRRLARVALGGPCGHNYRLLAVFILWAVACRMNDRRRIPMNHGTDGGQFFDNLQRRLATTDGKKSIVAIHQEVRRELKSLGLELPWYSQVMRNIEKQMFRNDQDPFHKEVGPIFIDFDPYLVETEDLLAVEIAMNSCQSFGIPRFTNVGDRFRTVTNTKKFGYPKSSADFQDLWQRIYVDNLRFDKKRRQQARDGHLGPLTGLDRITGRGVDTRFGSSPGALSFGGDSGGSVVFGDSPGASMLGDGLGDDLAAGSPSGDGAGTSPERLPKLPDCPLPGSEGLVRIAGPKGNFLLPVGTEVPEYNLEVLPRARALPALTMISEHRHESPYFDFATVENLLELENRLVL
ncbi:uncharacterized protein JN550_008602 [Neoarthrinium moseri]|uniref:uncharacterized protein n=1 Tax=Neoarthrinium moseri TaxID=1658444 RepID=UPI001FDB1B4C|nr:uncharacterized protein JN550_008602 [Neoarthrinium moseri]KAI1865056.1 hypothetical protein JN550_008602 [Neoarthrinium moseri]